MITFLENFETTKLPQEVLENGTRSYALATEPWNASLPFDASCLETNNPDRGVMTSLVVHIVSSLVFVVLGLVGNGLSIAVFTSREMRTISSNVYLFLLAVSDSIYLVIVFMFRLLPTIRCWYFEEAPIDLGNRSQFMCVALQYLSDLFSDYSTCLILAFTVERGMAVFCPITFRDRCTVGRARVACVAMFAVIGTVICPYHVIMMHLYVDYNVCAIDEKYNEMFAAMYAAEVVILRVLPVVSIAVLNAFIVVRVTRMTRDKKRRLRGPDANDGLTTNTVLARCENGNGGDAEQIRLFDKDADEIANVDNQQLCTEHHQLPVQKRCKSKPSRRASIDDRNLQLTIILILVSSSYILAYIPVLMHFVMIKMQMNGWIAMSEKTLAIFGNYGKTLYISGFAINFFLYTMSGRVFRDQLLAMLCPSGHRK